MPRILGLDIGGTKCAVTVGTYENGTMTVQGKRSVATDLSASPATMLGRLCQLADELLAGDSPERIGISCGGPLNSQIGLIQGPPNLPGWQDVPAAEILENYYGVPARLQNDANACAAAEWKFGAGRGLRNMVFLTFGTGLGAGLILNGQLYAGTNDMAGEAGHIRLEAYGPAGYGKRGSFEGFCSGTGLAQMGYTLAVEAVQKGCRPLYFPEGATAADITAKSVAAAAEQGDSTAQEVYRLCGAYLGRGLALLIDILNPEAIIIGSIFARAEGLLRKSMEEAVRREALPAAAACCRILPAQLGELFGRYPKLRALREELEAGEKLLNACFRQGGKLLLCGNGGSCADCDHIVGELMKGFLKRRSLSAVQRRAMQARVPALEGMVLDRLQGALPAVALPSMTALNSAYANDEDARLIYAQAVMGLGTEKDVLLAISTSGNAENVVLAAQVAKACGLRVLALTGASGGRLKEVADTCICAPETETFKVQECHLPIYHYLCARIEAAFFEE